MNALAYIFTRCGLGIAAGLFLELTTVAQTGPMQILPDRTPPVAAGLQPIGSLSASNRLNLAIALPLRHPDDLKKLVQRVSDPYNPNYRH